MLIKDRARCVPALKVDEKTLIADAEEADAIVNKFAK
jgi:hypothetical protein